MFSPKHKHLSYSDVSLSYKPQNPSKSTYHKPFLSSTRPSFKPQQLLPQKLNILLSDVKLVNISKASHPLILPTVSHSKLMKSLSQGKELNFEERGNELRAKIRVCDTNFKGKMGSKKLKISMIPSLRKKEAIESYEKLKNKQKDSEDEIREEWEYALENERSENSNRNLVKPNNFEDQDDCLPLSHKNNQIGSNLLVSEGFNDQMNLLSLKKSAYPLYWSRVVSQKLENCNFKEESEFSENMHSSPKMNKVSLLTIKPVRTSFGGSPKQRSPYFAKGRREEEKDEEEEESEDDKVSLPEFFGEMGSKNKFVNIENLGKKKKTQQHIRELIRRRSVISYGRLPSSLIIPSNPHIEKGEEEEFKLFRAGTEGVIKGGPERTKKITKMLKDSLFFFASLKLSLKEILDNKVFSSKPFEKRNSYAFINACKSGDLVKVQEFIFQNKFLVYEFDYVFLTGLHWAAKRGHFDVAKYLIRHGADINSKDMIGRTPLHLSIKHNRLDVMQLLLYNKADPWSTDKIDYKQLVKDKPDAAKILTKSRKLHILLKMTPYDMRSYIWEKDGWTILLNQGRNDNLLRRLLC